MALESPNRVAVYWQPPDSGWLKLNTDGSLQGNPRQSSYGGLIRDHHGDWVCGYAGKTGIRSCDTSLSSELWGISMGLRLIKDMKYKKVVVETDCEEALLLITVNELDESHPLSALIKVCRRDLVELGCYMVHVRRDGNRCADQMARIGRTQHQEFVVYNDPPTLLSSLLEEDVMGRQTSLL